MSGGPDVEVPHGGMDNAGSVVREGDTAERPDGLLDG
ncbi:hypothetical protein F558DRAFT_01294 [Streptomyces sp. AmelKG-A3]|nr:hypothetical protein GA0115247_130437 [Streptomyces sp. PalvLS-984]SDC18074.1 hypothetical protein F558DRAFT_01294 [Streptomyces sp. AmelKG-A3]